MTMEYIIWVHLLMGNVVFLLQSQPSKSEEYRQLFRLPPDEVSNVNYSTFLVGLIGRVYILVISFPVYLCIDNEVQWAIKDFQLLPFNSNGGVIVANYLVELVNRFNMVPEFFS